MSVADSIQSLQGYRSCVPIQEGYSTDQKYLVKKYRENFLLRIFPLEEYARKSEEFAVLKMLTERDVRASQPIEIGHVPGEKQGYMLLSFIEGENASIALPRLSGRQQYQVGVEAGLELRKMHAVAAPAGAQLWDDKKFAKHSRYLGQYRAGSVRIQGDTKIIAFIDRHLYLMKDRPNLFQHDDYHVKNLIVRNGKFAGIIDFNRHDWGDPIHEFLKVGQFSSEVSTDFSVGQIQGYFSGENPPEEFWKLYSLYLAMSMFSSIIWTQHACPDEMPQMMKILERVRDDHHGFERIQPKWYPS